MDTAKKILVIVNDAGFFLSHRRIVATAALEQGYQVHVATAPSAEVKGIRALGLIYHPIPLSRSGMRPWQELKSMWAIFSLLRTLKPDLVHLVTIKPMIYGGMMARLARVPALVYAVSGLGFVYISRGLMASIRRAAIRSAVRLALAHRHSKVIFQNPDDRQSFLDGGLVTPAQVVIIKGSGVDTVRFSPTPEPGGPVVVVLAARMLWDKGVGEYVSAARELKARGVPAKFLLVGDTDTGNPAAIPRERLNAWHTEGVVEWMGHRTDLERVFASCHIVCLPSYREGLPKVLIEAAAAGRPLVSTDVPGCREIALDGENALLVPAKNAGALADALQRLVEDCALRARFGRRSRELAVRGFSDEIVVRQHLELYGQLLAVQEV